MVHRPPICMDCGARLEPHLSKAKGSVYRCVRFPACGGWEKADSSGALPGLVAATPSWRKVHAEAHEVFDPLWKTVALYDSASSIAYRRVRCYEWLAAALKKPLGTCHLALCTEAELHTVCVACKSTTASLVGLWWSSEHHLGPKVPPGTLVPVPLKGDVGPVSKWTLLPLRVRIALASHGVLSPTLAVQVACGEIALPLRLRPDLLDALQGTLLLFGAVRGPMLGEQKPKPANITTDDYLASRKALVRYESLKLLK